MNITDIWKDGKCTYLYCVGDQITPDFSCNIVEIHGKKYVVDAFDVLHSITGKLAVVLRLITDETIPKGSVKFG